MQKTFTITITREVPAPNESVAEMIASGLAKRIKGTIDKIEDNDDLPF